jgi:hypothetical protein
MNIQNVRATERKRKTPMGDINKMKFECSACGGTGLYKGFAEPPGTAVICDKCKGKGWIECTYSSAPPFTHRKVKNGVTRVFADSGLWMFRNGNSPTVSINEFYDKVPVN